jgi:hypothetical protein
VVWGSVPFIATIAVPHKKNGAISQGVKGLFADEERGMAERMRYGDEGGDES